jgi:FAD synthase
VTFVARQRGEEKYDSLEALLAQIRLDIAMAAQLLAAAR